MTTLKLRPSELLDWIAGARRDSPPPAVFQLAVPEVEGMGSVLAVAGNWGFRLRTVETAGGFDFVLEGEAWGPHRQLLRKGVPEFADAWLIDWCKRADERRYEVRRTDSEVRSPLLASVESVVAEWPVLGPGGRLTVYADPRGITGEFVVRHRIRALDRRAEWRSPREILDRILPLASASSIIQADLGYCEASKFDRQTIMRPAYVFVVDDVLAPEGVNTRHVVVEAATDVEGLAPSTGLEAWSEEGD